MASNDYKFVSREILVERLNSVHNGESLLVHLCVSALTTLQSSRSIGSRNLCTVIMFVQKNCARTNDQTRQYQVALRVISRKYRFPAGKTYQILKY